MARGTVYLVEDDDAVRDALGLYLQARGVAVKQFNSAEPCLEAVKVATANICIVSDVRMPDMSGLQFQRRLAEQQLDVPIILITGHGDISMAVEALKSGAQDFIEKPVNESRLLQSVLEALEKHRAKCQSKGRHQSNLKRLSTLSSREREVMDLAVAGKTNREIAELLGISYRTVEIHRSKVMAKMEVATLADLVRCTLSLNEQSE